MQKAATQAYRLLVFTLGESVLLRFSLSNYLKVLSLEFPSAPEFPIPLSVGWLYREAKGNHLDSQVAAFFSQAPILGVLILIFPREAIGPVQCWCVMLRFGRCINEASFGSLGSLKTTSQLYMKGSISQTSFLLRGNPSHLDQKGTVR